MTKPQYIAVPLGDGTVYLQRTGVFAASDPPLANWERAILVLWEEGELARKAKDVMILNCWWPTPGMDREKGMVWKVETVDDHSDNALDGKWWPDPFTALTEADEWLKKTGGEVMTLTRQVEKVVDQRIRLERLAGEMLSTIKLNFERGYLTVQNDEGKLNLQKVIAIWERQLASIVEEKP